MADRIKQKIRKYDPVINLINTDDRRIVEEYGISRGICVNGKPVVKRMASWNEIERFIKHLVQH